MADRGAQWAAACAGTAAVMGAGTVAFLILKLQEGPPPAQSIPVWPIFIFAVPAVIFLVLAFAPALRFWPFQQLGKPPPAPSKRGPQQRRLEDLYKYPVWTPDFFMAGERGEHGRPCIALELTPPHDLLNRNRLGAPALKRDVGNVEITVWRLGKGWGPVTIPFEAGRFIVAFPSDFADFDEAWPPKAGRYTMRWTVEGEIHTKDFVLDEHFTLSRAEPRSHPPLPQKWRRRQWRRFRRRMALIRQGFPEPTGPPAAEQETTTQP